MEWTGRQRTASSKAFAGPPFTKTLDVMSPLRTIVALSSTLVGLAYAQTPTYEHVGDIPVICPITMVNAQTPVGFRVSPQEAVALASKNYPVKCNNIWLQSVYADSESYYIIKPIAGPMSPGAHAIVVDGRSGEVTERNKP